MPPFPTTPGRLQQQRLAQLFLAGEGSWASIMFAVWLSSPGGPRCRADLSVWFCLKASERRSQTASSSSPPMSPVVVRISLQGPEKQLAPAGRWRLSLDSHVVTIPHLFICTKVADYFSFWSTINPVQALHPGPETWSHMPLRHAERVCEAPNLETAKHGKTSHEARLSPRCATDLPLGKEKNTGAKPVIGDTHIYNAEAWKGEWEERKKRRLQPHDLKIPRC
ncbi:hypothetical protein Landi51_13366 [Colletotrichum acutatum]